MTFNVKITNNTAKTLELRLLDFFVIVTGTQVITLVPGAVHECQADCSEVDAGMKLWRFAQDQGVEYGAHGLLVSIDILPPTMGE